MKIIRQLVDDKDNRFEEGDDIFFIYKIDGSRCVGKIDIIAENGDLVLTSVKTNGKYSNIPKMIINISDIKDCNYI